MTPKLPVLIKNGKLNFQERDLEYIAAQRDGWYMFTLTKPKSNRTNKMNAYYWGVMLKMIAAETGYDDDQVHILMKIRHGIKEDLDIGMAGGFVPKSTTKYSVEEMQTYWLKITQWAASFLNLQIPEPNEVEF